MPQITEHRKVFSTIWLLISEVKQPIGKQSYMDKIWRQMPTMHGLRRIWADLAATEVNDDPLSRSEEHTSELQSLMRISYAVFCLTKKNKRHHKKHNYIESGH